MASKTYTNINSDRSGLDNITKFAGFYDNNYKEYFATGNSFIFVTRPMLFINPRRTAGIADTNGQMAYLNMTRDPIFNQYIVNERLNQLDGKIVESLSYAGNSTFESNFLPIFTNECKNFDTQDTNLEQQNAFDTKQGYTQPLPTFTTGSEASGQLTISVTEDANLDFTKMMTLWVKYIANVTDGTFDANPEMVLNGTLDYTCSIYYFLLEPDGKTLKYWAKYTGCWPTTIPYGALKYTKGTQDLAEMDINFVYTIKEDMNPKILEDFNLVALKLTNHASIKDELYRDVNGEYASPTQSPLFDVNALIEFTDIFKNDTHDPFVIYRSSNRNSSFYTDEKPGRYELLFDDNGYHSQFIDSVMPSNKYDYYIQDGATNEITRDAASAGYKYQDTGFWAEEEQD